MIHSVGLKLTSTFSFTYKSAELPRIGPYSSVINELTTFLSIFLVFIPCIPNCRGKRKQTKWLFFTKFLFWDRCKLPLPPLPSSAHLQALRALNLLVCFRTNSDPGFSTFSRTWLSSYCSKYYSAPWGSLFRSDSFSPWLLGLSALDSSQLHPLMSLLSVSRVTLPKITPALRRHPTANNKQK